MQVGKMDRQAVFEKVITHLYEQKSQAYKNGVGCSYRGTHGKTCAVGCLIKDNEYDPEYEGHAADTNRVVRAVEDSIGARLDSIDKNLLCSLQSLHDNYLTTRRKDFNKSLFIDNAQGIAHDYSLDTTFIGELRARP